MTKNNNIAIVRINEDLAKTIDDIVKSEMGKRYGFRSRDDFVTSACRILLKEYYDITYIGRGLLKEYSQVVPRLMHMNTYDDHTTIREILSGREINIYFRNGEIAHCDLCYAVDCEHVNYALSLHDVTALLKRKGWKRKFS